MKYCRLIPLVLLCIYATPSFARVAGPVSASEPNSMFVFMAVGLTLFLIKKIKK